MTTTFRFFATSARGAEQFLADELIALGASSIHPSAGGVGFEASIEAAYRFCLWSRIAGRVLLEVSSFHASSPDAIYENTLAVPWEDHLAPSGTFLVDASVSHSEVTHSGFAALRVKDGVVDRFRRVRGTRPSVDKQQPDLRIRLHLDRNAALLYIDLSGEALHRRGYRVEQTEAPLRENLAAAILLRAGWAELVGTGAPFIDPMCGSGTFPIEAALMAGDIAPGLTRRRNGFLAWLGHDSTAWAGLIAEARGRREEGIRKIPLIIGYDEDAEAIRTAHRNAIAAGLGERLRIERKNISDVHVPDKTGVGLLVTNPPYGERLGKTDQLDELYRHLGETIKREFRGWSISILCGNPDLKPHLGLRSHKRHAFMNGPIPCELLHYRVEEIRPAQPLGPGAEMLANRLRKNLKTIGRWASDKAITCYRLYDADIPEYAVAIDVYEDHAHVQEYAPPKTVDPAKAARHLQDVVPAVASALNISKEHISTKTRSLQKGGKAYGKLADKGETIEVREGGARFLINLTDRLDTGLFLDHRPTRMMIRELTHGKDFLNLFGYTGTASVHAALGGARTTLTVDLSATYLDIAAKNLELNGFRGSAHRMIRADVLEWLKSTAEQFDVIFLDPPTFSNSAKMTTNLDLQRDHTDLIKKAMDHLRPDGMLIFSTNNRRFKMDREDLKNCNVRDITKETIPRDFEKNARIHSCWIISWQDPAKRRLAERKTEFRPKVHSAHGEKEKRPTAWKKPEDRPKRGVEQRPGRPGWRPEAKPDPASSKTPRQKDFRGPSASPRRDFTASPEVRIEKEFVVTKPKKSKRPAASAFGHKKKPWDWKTSGQPLAEPKKKKPRKDTSPARRGGPRKGPE